MGTTRRRSAFRFTVLFGFIFTVLLVLIHINFQDFTSLSTTTAFRPGFDGDTVYGVDRNAERNRRTDFPPPLKFVKEMPRPLDTAPERTISGGATLRVTQYIHLDVYPRYARTRSKRSHMLRKYFDKKLRNFLGKEGKQICIACPVSLKFENRRIMDWIAYHSILGVDCFILLLHREHIVNQPEPHTNKRTVLDLLSKSSKNVKIFVSPSRAPSGQIQHILWEDVIESLRSIQRSKYVTYMDADEYVVLRDISVSNMPGALLRALLRRHIHFQLALPHVGHGLFFTLVSVGFSDVALQFAGRVADVGRAVQASRW